MNPTSRTPISTTRAGIPKRNIMARALVAFCGGRGEFGSFGSWLSGWGISMNYHQTLLCSMHKWTAAKAILTTIETICQQAMAFQSVTTCTMICQKGYVGSISHTAQVIKVIVLLFLREKKMIQYLYEIADWLPDIFPKPR
jgi:hypothetical protein